MNRHLVLSAISLALAACGALATNHSLYARAPHASFAIKVVLDSGVAVLRARPVTAEPNDDANVLTFFALPARVDP